MAVLAAYMVPHPPLIIPDIGKGTESAIQSTIDAYRKAAEKIGSLKPDTIVVISPHQVMYADYFHISPGDGADGDFGQFGAEQVRFHVTYDTRFVQELCRQAEAQGLAAGTLGVRGSQDRRLDHGTMVPLHFVNQYLDNYELVRIGLSGLSLAMHYQLGLCIQQTAELLNKNVVIIGSGDLSHKLKEDGPYGFQKEGPEYDSRIMDVMGRGAFGELLEFAEDFCEKAAECGHRSFTMMAGALDRLAVKTDKLSHEGPFGVGYGICMYQVSGPDAERDFLVQYERKERERLAALRAGEDEYVKLARKTIDTYVKTGKIPALPEDLSEDLRQRRAGAFVSIKEDGRLRGCIGTIQAVQTCLAEEIIYNAVSACSQDPRFSPIQPKELERLVISVDVLGDAERIDSPEQLDVKRYGVIVTNGTRRGLLLPDLEGVDHVRQQIAIAKQKAGIGDEEDVELERFEVVRHQPSVCPSETGQTRGH
ncbi:MAG: AmmeMemoRadiSam system protein A [Lachnospiraceae bacterium]|nr:AmmeMemoRadiSam system protein A [Lachnospiraceae bacterium]